MLRRVAVYMNDLLDLVQVEVAVDIASDMAGILASLVMQDCMRDEKNTIPRQELLELIRYFSITIRGSLYTDNLAFVNHFISKLSPIIRAFPTSNDFDFIDIENFLLLVRNTVNQLNAQPE
jgi:hypothetical protein